MEDWGKKKKSREKKLEHFSSSARFFFSSSLQFSWGGRGGFPASLYFSFFSVFRRGFFSPFRVSTGASRAAGTDAAERGEISTSFFLFFFFVLIVL